MEFKNVKILFEDNHVLIVNKPVGMLSQKDNTGDDSIIEVLKEYIKIKFNKPGNVFLGSVHRLDRPTSGVMIFAKTSKALTRLTKSLKAKGFDKKYYAVVEGRVTSMSGTLEHYLNKNKTKNIVSVYSNHIQGSKKSTLFYKTVSIENNYTLMKIKLLTGRSHQIRAQLSKSFFPIYGDGKYGSSVHLSNKGFCLHCYRLGFIHPVTKEYMSFDSLPDADKCIWKYFNKYLG